jgi:hypothetical protein
LTVWPVGGFGPNEPPELGSAQHPEPGQQPKEEQS